MPLRMTLDQAGPWIGGLGKQMPEAAKRGLYATALRVQQYLQASGEWPTDRGTSRAGWRAEPTDDGAEVFNVDPSSVFIEEGVRGENVKIGSAMIEALAAWAKRKGLGASKVPKRGGGERVQHASAEERTSIAWAIAKSMQKKGIHQPPLHLLKRTIENLAPAWAREEVARAIKEQFGL